MSEWEALGGLLEEVRTQTHRSDLALRCALYGLGHESTGALPSPTRRHLPEVVRASAHVFGELPAALGV